MEEKAQKAHQLQLKAPFASCIINKIQEKTFKLVAFHQFLGHCSPFCVNATEVAPIKNLKSPLLISRYKIYAEWVKC